MDKVKLLKGLWLIIIIIKLNIFFFIRYQLEDKTLEEVNNEGWVLYGF